LECNTIVSVRFTISQLCSPCCILKSGFRWLCRVCFLTSLTPGCSSFVAFDWSYGLTALAATSWFVF
jgi:hypothetical protein